MKPKLTSTVFAVFFVFLTACSGSVAPSIEPYTRALQTVTESPPEIALPTTTQTLSPMLARPTVRPAFTSPPLPATTALLTDDFAFGPTPQGGQIGGISGVFVHESSTDPDSSCGKGYSLLRFYADGLVLGVGTCFSGTFSENWPNIDRWFHRDNEIEISRGQYYLQSEHIWFRTTVSYSETLEVVIVDYSGTSVGGILLLDSYSHFNGYKSAGVEYVHVSVDQ